MPGAQIHLCPEFQWSQKRKVYKVQAVTESYARVQDAITQFLSLHGMFPDESYDTEHVDNSQTLHVQDPASLKQQQDFLDN